MNRPAATIRRVVVLVEGPSDAAVLRVLAAARGLTHLELVDMGGATNIGHHLTRLAQQDPGAPVTGLCDAAEDTFFMRALREQGHPVQSREDLNHLGFFVCEPDLEGELHRALGCPRVVAALDDLGDGRRFALFRRQTEWRGRPLADQLHRFAGTTSGRKVRLAEHLAGLLTPHTIPAPLRGVLDAVAQYAEGGRPEQMSR